MAKKNCEYDVTYIMADSNGEVLSQSDDLECLTDEANDWMADGSCEDEIFIYELVRVVKRAEVEVIDVQ